MYSYDNTMNKHVGIVILYSYAMIKYANISNRRSRQFMRNQGNHSWLWFNILIWLTGMRPTLKRMHHRSGLRKIKNNNLCIGVSSIDL
jgi:hypothetical protein